MADFCNSCRRPMALSYEAWRVDKDGGATVQNSCAANAEWGDDFWCDETFPDCAHATIAHLRSQLAARDRFIEEAKRLRRACAVHGMAFSCLPAFDDAMAKLDTKKAIYE